MNAKKRKSYSDAEKALLVETYKASGKQKKPWCEDNGIGLSTLQRWLKQEKTTTKNQPMQNWVSVIPAVPAKPDALEIQIGKCTLPINHQTDLSLLARVLKVLVDAC